MAILGRLFGVGAHKQQVPRLTPVVTGQRPSRSSLPSPAQVFTPTRPKTGKSQVFGRETELASILRAFLEDRSHVVLFAERGRGKTSISNLVVEALRRNSVVVARFSCDADSNFETIIRGLMQDLPSSLLAASAGATADETGEGCQAALPERLLRPGDVLGILHRIACRNLVCVVDEFDRVLDGRTRTLLADTIKQLSDRNINLRFFIVGVSDDLDSILGQHPSIQRGVLGVHLPLFSDEDVAHLIEKSGKEIGYSFPPPIIASVVGLARGMPYIAQLVGLRLAQSAAARNDFIVREIDLQSAAGRMLADTNPRVPSLYAMLTDGDGDTGMTEVLWIAASAPQDAWGRLMVRFTAEGAVVLAGRMIPATHWTVLETMKIVEKCTDGPRMYLFRDRELMHHVLLLAVQDSLENTPVTSAPLGAWEAQGHQKPVLSRA